MNTSNKKLEEISVLLSTIISLVLLISVFTSGSVLGRDKISASKTFGTERDQLSITLSSKTVLKLEVLPDTFKDNTRLTLSEAEVIPYNKDIIGLLSVKIENDDITHKIKKPLIIKAFPVDGIDQSRVKMIQTFILRTKKSGKQYWSRVPFSVDKLENSINMVIEDPGIYKIQYSKLKVGNGGEGFFRLDAPNKPRGDAKFDSDEYDAKFSLYFTGTGEDVYFIVKDEFENELWNGSEDGDVSTITSSGWFPKTIDYSHFINIQELAYLKDRGKFEITCYDQDIDFDDELWGAYFIRDRDGIYNADETTVKKLLNDYSPYVFYGDTIESVQANTNPWNYVKEMVNGEIYYPIDIRELVTYYAPNFEADGITDFHIGVGNKIVVNMGLDYEHVLSNTNIVKSTSDNGIDIASYNDSIDNKITDQHYSYEYGMFRNFNQYDLLEFQGPDDEPYVAGINNNTFPDLKNRSKIYCTAYEYNGFIFLQYFFYYPFDPKNGDGFFSEGISRHAGDWERFVVILKKDANNIINSAPVGSYFFHHLVDQVFAYYGDNLSGNEKFSWNKGETSPGAYVDWNHVEKTNNHPHIYVAQGSHGIYFRQGSYSVDIPKYFLYDTLKEYAGGQVRKEYSTVNGNLVYVPRLSEIDTETKNTEFSFLLFSGPVAETSKLFSSKIYFPPYNDVWYAADKYCFNGTTFQPRNNVTADLSKITIAPSVSIVSPLVGANLNGVVNVIASASPLNNVSKVEFYLDSALKFTDYSDPYSWSWDTTKDTNGTHNLTAKAIALAGDNGDAPAVSVTVNNSSGNAPNTPTDLAQYKSNGATSIAIGITTNERIVVMKGKVTDPDNNPVSLEVEFKPIGTSFSNVPSPEGVSGGTVASGLIAVVTCSGLADGQYHWQARAKDSKGAVSNWLSMGGNSESVPDFVVSASLLKVGDWVQTNALVNVRDTPGGNLIKENMPVGSIGQIKEGPQSASFEEKLYTWWRIQWIDQDKTFGWSIQDPLVPIGNYPPLVTVNAPNGGETLKVGTSYEIKWAATDTTGTIQRIDIYRSNDDGGSWSTIASNEANDGSYSWTPLTQTTQGRIKVEATDSFGSKGNDMSNGNFSVVGNCQAPAVPTLYTISTSSNSYYVTWSAASGASYYNLQEDDSSSFSSPTVVYTNNGTSWYSGDKLPGTYYYRVKAINDCGVSDWSNTQSVIIQGDQGPGEITALNPADNAKDQPLTVTLQWSASHAGGESLRYNVYVVEADTTIFYPNNIKSYEQTGKTYSISSIPYNTVISWGIEAIDDTGDRRFSSMFHFTTIGDNGAPIGSILINNGAASTTSYSVTLNLSATDSGSGVRSMKLSNDGTHWTYWVPFSTQYSWNLADTNYGGQYGLATYTVYAQFRDYEDNESQVYSDTITKADGTPGQILLNGKVYQTIQDAIDAANPGDTVCLTEGFYSLKGTVHPNHPIHPDRYFGIAMKGGVTLKGAGADKTTISVEDVSAWGILDADNSVIEGLTVINNIFSGGSMLGFVILLESDSSKVKNCIIRGGTTGIYVGWNTEYSASNSEIINNLIIDNRDPGIWLNSGTNIAIHNNTISNNAPNGYAGIFGWVGQASIINNIITNNGIGVWSYDSPLTFKHNDVYGNGTNYVGSITNQTGTNGNISSDPSFVNVSSGDCRLNAGSPCINAGTNVGIPFDGGAPDMGAFEYNGVGTIQVTSNRADASFTIRGPSGAYNGNGTGWSMSNLPIGIYTITFIPIANLYSPPYQAKMLYSGQTLTFDGVYQADTVGPAGMISVNFNEYATAEKLVIVTFDITDEVGGLGDSSQMMFSNDGVTWSTPETYSSLKKDWDVTLFGGNATSGEKTVYAKVSDVLGNWSTLTDTIKYVPDRKVLEVPTQYSTIQSAIDAALDGDMVYVYPGDHGGWGGSITLKEGIRLQGAGPLVTVFNNGYMRITMAKNSMLDGFSGYIGVFCESSSESVIVSNNWIKRGININATNIILRNNIISNTSGIGIAGYTSTDIFIENNTFVNLNNAIFVTNAVSNTKVYLNNNIITNNGVGVSEMISLDTSHQHIFPSFNTYWNNTKNFEGNSNNVMGAGDINADPLFVDLTNNDFHLKAGSPAINSGNPETRYNDPDGTRNDRGGYGGPSLNTSPKADFSTEPALGGVGTVFTFDGSLSTDIESKGDQLRVRWDLDGDNNFDTLFSLNKKIVHQYDTEGNYNVTLEVQDKGGFVFSTAKSVAVINQTPNVPSNPTPADGATGQPRDIVLRWNGGDADINDTVAYDVYFGTTSNPPLISSDQPDTSLQPGVLLSTTTYYWKIVAKDNHSNTSIGPLWHFTTAYTDIIQPQGTISINNNEAYTTSKTVTLTLYAADNIGITGYYVSENPSAPQASDTNWISVNSIINYSANIPYVLSSADGNKTVYAWYKDAAGNVSAVANDAITLDTKAPTVSSTSPASNATGVALDGVVVATFSEAMKSSTITISTFTVNDGTSNISGAISYSGATATFKPTSNLISYTTYTVTIMTGVTDEAGNAMAANYTWKFTTADTVSPSGTVTINSNATYTNSTGVTLNLKATDGVGVTGYYAAATSTAPSPGAEGWTAVTLTTDYSANVPFTLSSSDGEKMVHVWYKDAAGNVSSAATDAITLKEFPVVSIFQINNGATDTTSCTVTLNNTATGSPTDYRASESPTFKRAKWKAYTVAPKFTLSAKKGVKTVYLGVKNINSKSSVVNDTITLKKALAVTVADAGVDQLARRGSVITLDGSRSYSTEENVPLTYQWGFVSLPSGVGSLLSDSKSVNPTFVFKRQGKCEIQLVVKDCLGMASEPDTVVISTQDTTPVAHAGSDQFISEVGTRVMLNGAQSYDPDGDALVYQWAFISRPAESVAYLNGADMAQPTFVADVPGDYVMQLTVTDSQIHSSYDTMTVSFGNVRPVANAGKSLAVKVGDTVTLTGDGTDANGDALRYRWILSSLPGGSLSEITDSSAMVTSITPDRAGTYVAQLVVSDGEFDSEPCAIQIQAFTTQTNTITALQGMETVIAELASSAFKNADMQNLLLNKLNAVIANVEAGNNADASNQIRNDILPKMGDAGNTAVDSAAWIIDRNSQQAWYQDAQDVVRTLEMAR